MLSGDVRHSLTGTMLRVIEWFVKFNYILTNYEAYHTKLHCGNDVYEITV